MKKNLLSLLTTVAFTAPTFAADAELTTGSESAVNTTAETSNNAQRTWKSTTDFEGYDTSEHGATNILSLFSRPSRSDAVTIEQVREAIHQGGSFAGNDDFDSPLHNSASQHPLELFKPFLEACLDAYPDYVTSRSDDAPRGTSTFDSLLLHAAHNPDPRVAELLINTYGLRTDSKYALYFKILRFTNFDYFYMFTPVKIYPLFEAMYKGNTALIPLLNQGLTDDQIKETEEQVKKVKNLQQRAQAEDELAKRKVREESANLEARKAQEATEQARVTAEKTAANLKAKEAAEKAAAELAAQKTAELEAQKAAEKAAREAREATERAMAKAKAMTDLQAAMAEELANLDNM